MSNKILYIGLDVDDKAFHGGLFSPETGEVEAFKCRPTLKGLETRIKKVQREYPSYEIKLCYEATYIGFSLQRDLSRLGIHCDVIAPNSIPRIRGNQIKTDRVDAEKLARFYANGQLTVVVPPDLEQEKDRDLLRSRQYVLQQLSQMKSHIQSLLRRNGLHYKKETAAKSNWTLGHKLWIERTIELQAGSFKRNLELLYQQMKWLDHTLSEYNQSVEEMAKTERYEKPVQALTCYKGIKNVFALSMITEIGNITRFSHPRNLVSYIGLDIREYSSGGVHHRFGITKHGNKYLRTAFVEANQRGYKSYVVGKALKLRRKNTAPELIHIADRCLRRTAKKGNRLLGAGKNSNKVKVACAREMVGFVWESLKTVAV